MENTQKNKQLISAITIIIVIATGLYIYQDVNKSRSVGDLTNGTQIEKGTPENATTTVTTNGGTVELVENISAPLPQPVPKFGRTMPANTLPVDAQAIITANIAKYSTELTKDPRNVENWIMLGVQYKIAGDYEGAVEAWTYATKLAPQSSIAFRNMGDTYAFYLHDNVKAEENLLKAIKNSPEQIEYYFKAVDFYSQIMKDPAKARAIVEQGIKSNPASTELKSLLASIK